MYGAKNLKIVFSKKAFHILILTCIWRRTTKPELSNLALEQEKPSVQTHEMKEQAKYKCL